jgi:hypothetical protein
MAANIPPTSNALFTRGQTQAQHAGATCPYCCHQLDVLGHDVDAPTGIRALGEVRGSARERHVDARAERASRAAPQPDYPPTPDSRRLVCQHCRLMFEGAVSLPDLTDDDRQRVLLAGYRARRAHDRFLSGREERFRAVSELAEAFVCLQGAPGIRPFCATTLHGWASEQQLGDRLRECVAFILHVADAGARWSLRFEVPRAMERWDTAQRAVFVEWARRPWWA